MLHHEVLLHYEGTNGLNKKVFTLLLLALRVYDYLFLYFVDHLLAHVLFDFDSSLSTLQNPFAATPTCILSDTATEIDVLLPIFFFSKKVRGTHIRIFQLSNLGIT